LYLFGVFGINPRKGGISIFIRRSFLYWHGFQACGVKPNFPESPFSRVYTNNPIVETPPEDIEDEDEEDEDDYDSMTDEEYQAAMDSRIERPVMKS